MKNCGLENGENGLKPTAKESETFQTAAQKDEEVITGNIFEDIMSENKERCKDLFYRLCQYHKFVPICFQISKAFNQGGWTAAMAYDNDEIRAFEQEFIREIEDKQLTYTVSQDFGLSSHHFLSDVGHSAHAAMFHLLERYRLTRENLEKYNSSTKYRHSWAIHNDSPMFQCMLEERYTRHMIKFDTLDVLDLELSVRGI